MGFGVWTGDEGNTEYTLELATKPFEFAVLRKGSNDSVFDTRGQRLVFKACPILLFLTSPCLEVWVRPPTWK